jgi:hypothetical protein
VLAATERVVREFCVGESMSLALLTACRSAARRPLLREVIARILDDEKRHAAFGWLFLDWAAPQLDKRARSRVTRAARDAIAATERFVATAAARPGKPSSLGMMGPIGHERYVECAQRAIERQIRRPLRRYKLDV